MYYKIEHCFELLNDNTWYESNIPDENYPSDWMHNCFANYDKALKVAERLKNSETSAIKFRIVKIGIIEIFEL